MADCLPAAGVERVRQSEFKQGEVVSGTRYRVLGLLGVGGMGSVYEVEHTELGKRFVLKALLSELAMRTDLVARLRNEQRALGRLEHPNIVAVTDAGVTTANVPYFVMERLEGETLSARMKRHQRLPVIEALAVATGVLEGLAAAHEIGVVHRDIKPQNILLVNGIRPKILDFGVAKVADIGHAITQRGVAVGTPRYMSPEQAKGEAVDGRSDLYAVGLLLFEMVVGQGPFDDARDPNEMLLAHLGRPVPRLIEHAQGITPELDEFLASLLAKEPSARPPTARSAAASLRMLAQAYGPAREADARALLAGNATHPFGVPVPSRPPAPTTHADGIAARHGRQAEAPTDEANTLAKPRVMSAGGTLIDDWGSQRAHDTQSASATTASSTPNGHFPPTGVTRTEILSTVGVPPKLSGNEETRTAVPLTPNDGSRTLHPLPAASVEKARGRGRVFGVAVAALALGGGGAWFALSRPPSPRGAASASASPPSFAAASPPAPLGAAPPAAAPPTTTASAPVAARAATTEPAAPSTPAASPARPASPLRPLPRPTAAGQPGKTPVSPTPSVAKSPTIKEKAAELRKVSSGLPGSGL